MGFPFHKRTSDMRDEEDPELQVDPSPVYALFKEVKEVVSRFALLVDYSNELKVCGYLLSLPVAATAVAA